MRIYVPDMELVGTLKFANDIYEIVPNDEVVFDFSKMHNFDPLHGCWQFDRKRSWKISSHC